MHSISQTKLEKVLEDSVHTVKLVQLREYNKPGEKLWYRKIHKHAIEKLAPA